MERFKIVPKQGLIIRDPTDMKIVLPEGKLVYKTPYWSRLIKDGDVTIESPEKSKPVPKKKKENISKEMKSLNSVDSKT